MKHFRYLVFVFCLLLLTGCSGTKKEALELKGDKKITLNVNDSYKEPGTNLEDCQIEGKVDTSKEGKYKLTYTCDDQKLTRTVYVVDPDRIIKT